MKKLKFSLFLGLLVIALVAGACGGSGDEDGSEASAMTEDEYAASIQNIVTNLSKAYERSEGIWAGFAPGEHPAVVPFRVGGVFEVALAINHPNPSGIGTATALDTDGTPFDSLHRLEELNDDVVAHFARIDNFDFHADLGDVNTYVIMADRDAVGLDPAELEWTSTYIHEMFHRYQDDAFLGDMAYQDVEGYAYTRENLELAVLEERALNDGLEATTDEAREIAARRFAALRLVRLEGDDRVVLDGSQERIEGTARYLEHRLSSDDHDFTYHADNYTDDLAVSFDRGGVKETFGFGRFYSSGAAVLRLLDLFGTENVVERIEAGEQPTAILIDELGVQLADADALVADARAAYDPSGELPDLAEAAGAKAKDEESFFDSDSTSETQLGGSNDLTPEQEACLEEAGALEEGEIPDEVFERCISG